MQTNNRNVYEYVLSGCSFSRIIFKESWEHQQCLDFIIRSFAKMQINGYRFALLYNAYAEKKFGQIFRDNYGKALRNIYADSGGLQAITQGAQITPEMKNMVYQNQGEYSTIAMSFDEIPLSMTGERSKRLDTSGRWFDHTKFDACASHSGRNLKEQIEKFADMKSKAKPVLICHGNSYDTFMRWTELVLKEIPQELHQFIGGIALSSGSHGRGTLEDIQRAFYYTQLPINVTRKHLHLLGVGSVYRLLPTMTFVNNGVYQDTLISFDSTTHSSAPHFGRYLLGESDVNFGRHIEPKVIRDIYNDVSKKFPMEWDEQTFFDAMTWASKRFEKQYGSRDILIMSFVAFILSSVYNFMDSVMSVQSVEDIVRVSDERGEASIFKTLYDVKTMDDFKYWEQHVGRYCTSEKIQDSRPASLKDWFD